MTDRMVKRGPIAVLEAAIALLDSTAGEEYSQVMDRNADLTALAYSLGLVLETVKMTDEGLAATLKEHIACAYLLGRRDGTAIPESFRGVELK